MKKLLILGAGTAGTLILNKLDKRLEDFDVLNECYEAPNALEDAQQFTVEADVSQEATMLKTLRYMIRLMQHVQRGDDSARL